MALMFSHWLAAELEKRHWDQADLVRRCDLEKGEISRIIRGGSKNPSAEAVAEIAKGLDMEPSEVLRGIHLWHGPNRDPIPNEAAFVYRQLDQTQRKALVSVARVLREAQHEYERRQPDEEDEFTRARRLAEEWRDKYGDDQDLPEASPDIDPKKPPDVGPS